MMGGQGAALILVDLQRDFLARPGIEPHPDAVVDGASRWLAAWRAERQPVAHVLTRVSRCDDRRLPHWKSTGLWACEEGTPGERPPECLAPAEGEPVFFKSGYLPADPGEIARWARSVGVERVVLAGVMTHACVAHLAAALLGCGLEVAWAAGSLGSDRPQLAAHVLAHFAAKGVTELSLGADEAPGGGESLEAAVQAARAAPPESTRVRSALLAWAVLLERAGEELAREITHATGKPVAMARAEVRHAAALIREGVEWRDRFQEQRSARGGIAARRPLGVVAVITPWNNPVSIPAGRIAPAFAYGNTVVWKPAPQVRAVSERLVALAREAGLPLQFCAGGADAGQRLVWHPAVDAVTFSGSLTRGRMVLAAAAERLVPCQVEMGGNNAAVVAEDTDAAAAAGAVLAGAFGFAGQRCTANRRAILLPGVRDAFVQRAHDALDEWLPEDPFEESCRIGPVIDAAAAERIEALLSRAKARGARVIRPQRDQRLGPRHVAPALVMGAAEDSEIVTQESFGPVLVIQEARDWEEALRLLNAVPQGLAAALFSRSQDRWEMFKQHARAGILRRNQATAGALEDLPFGGWKASGWGGAEHAEANALFFTRLQAWVQSNDLR